MLARFNRLFPLWALLISLLAFFLNAPFAALSTVIVPLLATVMFMMGLTLTKADIERIVKDPKPILVGVILQFVLMPVLALTFSKMFQLSNQLTIGMVLVGSCAGGTASNVVCYLAKGDVALSISMTMVSTLVGVIATPLLCAFYLSETVSVDRLALLFSLVQIVFIPVVLGFACKFFLNDLANRVETLIPTLSVLLILLIIAIVVALNADRLLDVGLITLIAVILHNLSGLAGGYTISRLIGLDIKQSQTVAIEVGMQNSGLGVALATEFFSATAALPGALFSVWHNISGSLLASVWSNKRTSLEYLLKDEESSLPPK
jgi:BASS family bile acid:Na+ symporter|tara:strand:+ start:1401 stop:2357 length:957 start_codon:yes stop_codon:yes gene_type:complete